MDAPSLESVITALVNVGVGGLVIAFAKRAVTRFDRWRDEMTRAFQAQREEIVQLKALREFQAGQFEQLTRAQQGQAERLGAHDNSLARLWTVMKIQGLADPRVGDE